MAGDVIESLSIELNSNATKANKSVDELIGKLGNLANSLSRIDGSGLSGLANGVGKLANSMQGMKGIGEAKFQNLANGINKLSAIDTAGLNKSANSLYQITKSVGEVGKVGESTKSITDLATNLSQLGDKGVSNAVTNIPKLATAMKNLITTLSTAPKVSNNLIQMTTALAGLASNGQKVGSATKGLTSSFKTYNNSATSATSRTKSLASMFGRLYANFFWVKRGISGIKDAVESSMDYIETLNYFDAAFGQVAETAVKDWKSAGYKSAEEYYNSFSERAKKLTSQMSGFDISPTGTLESTGKASLGIDPDQLMNYQATFAQMSSSIGITAENSLKLSRALTEIGADLASVKNMDFKKTWNDMASGLAGMSRTLDKYGVNIRNVNLQQELSNIGIQTTIDKLNQNEKALLRTVILLNSTKYAWGDLSETLNQPANQVRLLQSNFQNLTRTIGNLFLPVVAKILPYINGLTIALQRLFSWIGKSLGIDMSKITSSVGDSSFDMSELADGADDVASGFDDASDKAKKLKQNINTIGIDKLNIISKDKDTTSKKKSGTGLGKGDLAKLNKAFDDAYSKYQKAWNKAFAGVDNKALQIADRITKAFKKGDYYGIGEFIGESITKGLNKIPWNTVYQGAKNFGKGFAEFLNGLISPELFGTVGKTIAGVLNTSIYNSLAFAENFDFVNLGESIASGINNFFKTYDFTALAKNMNTWANGIYATLWNIVKNIHWGSVLKGAFDFISELEPQTVLLIALGKKFKTFTKDAGVIGGLGKVFKTAGGNIAGALNKIIPSLKDIGVKQTASKGINKISTSFKNLRSSLTATQKGVIGVVSVWAEFKTLSSTFKGMAKGTENLSTGIMKIVGVSALAGTALYTAFGPLGLAAGAIAGIAGALKGITDAHDEEIKKLKELTPEQKALTDEIHKSYEAYKDLDEQRKNQFDNINIEYDSTSKLADELDTIVDKNGKIKKGYEDRAKVILTQINESLGTEYSIVDGQIQKYKELESQIKKTIEQKKLNALIDANKDAYTEALKNQREAQKEMTKAKEEYDKQNVTTIAKESQLNREKEKLNKLQEKLNNSTPEQARNVSSQLTEQQNKVKKLQEEYDALNEENKKLKKTYEEAESTYSGYASTIKNQNKAIEASVSGNVKKMKQASTDISNNFISASTGTIAQLEKQVDDYKGQLEEDRKDLANGVAGVTKDTIKETETLLKNSKKELEIKRESEKKSREQDVKDAASSIPKEFKNTDGKLSEYGKNAINSFVGSMGKVDLSEKLNKLKDTIFKGLSGEAKIDLKLTGATKSGADKILENTGPGKIKQAMNLGKIDFSFRAVGGFPDVGELFIANEAGPELIGTMNGKTAVASNGEITGIVSAINQQREEQNRLLMQQNQYLMKILEKDNNTYIDGKQITKTVNRNNARSGVSMLGFNNGYI